MPENKKRITVVILFRSSPTWIRTKTDRTKICSATITPSDYPPRLLGLQR